MKFNQLNNRKTFAALAKTIHARFGYKINESTLTHQSARKLLAECKKQTRQLRESRVPAGQNNALMLNKMVAEAMQQWIVENEIDVAQVVMASRDMVDRVQKMVEDLSKVVHEDLAPLSDQIRDARGQEAADQYVNTVRAAVESALETLGTTRTELDNATRRVAGEEVVDGGDDFADAIGGEAPDADLDSAIDGGDEEITDFDAEPEATDDEDMFAVSAAASGEDEAAGREAR